MVQKKGKSKTKAKVSKSKRSAQPNNLLARQMFELVLVVIIVGLLIYIFLGSNKTSMEGQQVSDYFDEVKQGILNCSVYNISSGNETLNIIDANCVLPYYQLGLNNGFTYAIVSIMNRTQNCSIVPLYYENYTVNIIDVACVTNQQ